MTGVYFGSLQKGQSQNNYLSNPKKKIGVEEFFKSEIRLQIILNYWIHK